MPPPYQRRGLLARIFRATERPPVPVAEPILRRLSTEEQAIVHAASLFNAGAHRRTVEGLMRSLGPPRASVIPLSGTNREVVITIFWDISWYQYRVVFDAPQPVQLAERGYDPAEIAAAFTDWNAEVAESGVIVPTIAPE